MATFKTNTTQVLEIKASDLDRDVLDILEGIIGMTTADTEDGMWLIKMETLIETLQDDGLPEGYEDAFKEQWTAFVKQLDTLNAISPFKYVMLLQKLDEPVSEKCIYKRYAIIKNINDLDTGTLEDYNDEKTARAAFEAIRRDGSHLPENADSPYQLIMFDGFDKVVFTMDVELWDEHGNYLRNEPIKHTPFALLKGKPFPLSYQGKVCSARFGWDLAESMLIKENNRVEIMSEDYIDLLKTYKAVMDSLGYEAYEFHYVDDIKNNPGTSIQHIRDVCKKAVESGAGL